MINLYKSMVYVMYMFTKINFRDLIIRMTPSQ